MLRNFDFLNGPKIAEENDIYSLSRMVDRVEIIELSSGEIKYEIETKEEVKALFHHLNINPSKGAIRWQRETAYGFKLFSDQKEIGTIEYLNVYSVGYLRWLSNWMDDPQLKNHENLLLWLFEKGIKKPLGIHQKEQKEREEALERFKEYLKTIPESLVSALKNPRYRLEFSITYKALEEEIPLKKERIYELFRALGSYGTRWDISFRVDMLIEGLLSLMPLEELIEIVEIPDMDENMLKGMARFFFRKTFENGIENSPIRLPTTIEKVVNKYQEIQKNKSS